MKPPPWCFGDASTGRPKKRIRPRIKNRVNRDIYNGFLRQIAKTVHQLPPPWKSKSTGRPCRDPRACVILIEVHERFQMTYEDVESFSRMHIGLHHLVGARSGEQLPGHSVIHRAFFRIPMRYWRRLNRLQLRPVPEGEPIVAIPDSTGMSTRNTSTWYDIRIHRCNTRHDHVKVHLMLVAATGQFADFRINGRGDATQLPVLLSTFSHVDKVPGDKAYASRANCRAVVAKGGVPYFALKKQFKARAQGCIEWRRMVLRAWNDPVTYGIEYHERSRVESSIFSLKRRTGSRLTTRKNRRYQARELAAEIVAFNASQALYIDLAEEEGESLWVEIECN